MNKHKTPDWLKEIQNKSWEPEILISGITLTFVFILSTKIYNFCGMLIQDLGVDSNVAGSLYIISIFLSTGLKIILITHLMFRGLWAGMVGLSYVFPKGINKQNLPKSKKNIIYDDPDTFVIKLEKICSMLFSFVFASIGSVILAIIGLFPIILLYIFNLEFFYFQNIVFIYGIIIIIGSILFAVLLNTRFKNTNFKKKMDNSLFEYLTKIYSTNLGKMKTNILFTSFSLIILLFAFNDMIYKFRFKNYRSSKFSSNSQLIQLQKDHYESERDQKLRIPKATIDQFKLKESEINLFISFYKEDLYTIKEIKQNPEIVEEYLTVTDSCQIEIPDLYQILIDDKMIPGLRWYSINHKFTDQKGLITTIPLDSVKNDYHELKINKIYWSLKKDSLHLIENWDIIPFEKGE